MTPRRPKIFISSIISRNENITLRGAKVLTIILDDVGTWLVLPKTAQAAGT